ncbi:DUF6787 family protein [Limibacter armeniacum]|uniref:DUF6787 family protein n=1 Tax=Limibacter armeniacum TaxID=466084 RepID=UPI002FE52451
MSRLAKMKEKWGVNSGWQVLAILLAFTFAGSSVVVVRKMFFSAIGITEQTEMWIKVVTYILFIFPAYQTLLLFYGTILGQFNFFWEKEKKMFKRMAGIFKR